MSHDASINPHIIRLLPESLNDIRILDCGMGYGYWAYYIKTVLGATPHIVGIDTFEGHIETQKKLGLYDEVYQIDVSDLPFPSNSFDLVIATEVIEHLSKNDGYKAISGIERVASDRVILSVPNGPRPQSESYGNKYEAHQSSWWKRDLENLGYHVILVIGPELHKSLALVESIRRFIFRINYMGILVASRARSHCFTGAHLHDRGVEDGPPADNLGIPRHQQILGLPVEPLQ